MAATQDAPVPPPRRAPAPFLRRLRCLAPLAFVAAVAPARGQAQWEMWTPAKITASSGATFTPQPDGSLLVGGANPEKETFTVELQLDRNGWTGMRLETLADRSLGGGGPGRAANGNFVLTEVKVVAAPRNSDGFKAVGLERASADFEQPGFVASMAADGAPFTGWAIAPEFGKNHDWIVEFARPLAFDGGVKLLVTLEFQFGGQHVAGRLRLSGSTSPRPLRPPVIDEQFGQVAGQIPGSRRACSGSSTGSCSTAASPTSSPSFARG